MKKLITFIGVALLLVGCSTGEEPKTKPNPFKEETTSSQDSSQSNTTSTSTVTTTKSNYKPKES